jgi:hypothetical protein
VLAVAYRLMHVGNDSRHVVWDEDGDGGDHRGLRATHLIAH